MNLYYYLYLMNIVKHTISPLGNSGGSHEMSILVLEAGIALIACGAEGTKNDFCKNKYEY